jgi:hypothetical protein
MRAACHLDGLFKDLDDSPAGVKLLVDACGNEVGSKRFDTGALKPARGIAALFSCAASQKSHESAKCWGSYGRGCRAALRSSNEPGDRNHAIGFRVVRVAPRTP